MQSHNLEFSEPATPQHGDLGEPVTRSANRVLKILLCWGYYRSAWIEAFEQLKARFRFTYIFYRCKEEEEACLTNEPVLYWNDFENAHQILDVVRPDKIVFMSLTSGYPIALNIAAQHRGIATFILQHGWAGSYADERVAESRATAIRKARGWVSAATSSSMGFLVRTLRLRDVPALPRMLLFFLMMRRSGYFVASRYGRFRQRMPTGYICFTEPNATIYRELDRARPDQIHIIGIPEYDKFFIPAASTEHAPAAMPYYLLIDQPLSENKWGSALVSREEMIRFYRKLSAYCKNQKARLKVKLHPESYNCVWLPQDANVEWIRDADVVALIRGAEGCFGMFSSLVLPAAVFQPLCLFNVQQFSMVADLSRRGLAVVLDFFKFQPADITFPQIDETDASFSRFVSDYFFKADGRSVDRLFEVLRQ
jgi:hypothetical protein